MSMEDLFRLARTSTVAQLRSSATTSPSGSRTAARSRSLSYLYPLLQGYDSVAIRAAMKS